MDMHNIAAIVTGGASGLGKATATMLAARGARVAILDLNEAAASAAAQDLGGLAFALNVADDAAVAAALDAAERAHGVARILVNCAGVASLKQSLLDAQERGVSGRVLVSQYLNFSDPSALRHLLRLSNLLQNILYLKLSYHIYVLQNHQNNRQVIS